MGKCNITPLLRFENANFEFERKHCSVVKWKTGSTMGCKVSRDVADGAVMVFRVVDANVSSKFFAFHSNMSDFPAVVVQDETGPNAIGGVMSRSLTVMAKARVRHGLALVKSSNVLRYYRGG